MRVGGASRELSASGNPRLAAAHAVTKSGALSASAGAKPLGNLGRRTKSANVIVGHRSYFLFFQPTVVTVVRLTLSVVCLERLHVVDKRLNESS